MKLSEKTKAAQGALADYCRTGADINVPGARKKRLPHYRRLVRNVIHNTLEQAFPITYELLETDTWENLVDEFFVRHNPQTPQVWKLPEEFYHFLRDHGYAEKLNRPYLNDLLHMEWIEIEVHTMPDEKIPLFSTSGDLENDVLICTPEFQMIELEYPVHLMSAADSLKNKGRYYLLVFREHDTGNVKFMNLSILLAYIIEQLHFHKKTLNETLQEVKPLFGISDMDDASKKIRHFLGLMQNQKFLLGFKPS